MPLSKIDSAYADLTAVKLKLEGLHAMLEGFVEKYQQALDNGGIYAGSPGAKNTADKFEESLTKYDTLCNEYSEKKYAYIEAGGNEPEFSPPVPAELSGEAFEKHIEIRDSKDLKDVFAPSTQVPEAAAPVEDDPATTGRSTRRPR